MPAPPTTAPPSYLLCSSDVYRVKQGNCVNQRTWACLYPRQTGSLPFFFFCTCSPRPEIFILSCGCFLSATCEESGACSKPRWRWEGVTSSSTVHLLFPFPPTPPFLAFLCVRFIPFFHHSTKEKQGKCLQLDLFTVDPFLKGWNPVGFNRNILYSGAGLGQRTGLSVRLVLLLFKWTSPSLPRCIFSLTVGLLAGADNNLRSAKHTLSKWQHNIQQPLLPTAVDQSQSSKPYWGITDACHQCCWITPLK